MSKRIGAMVPLFLFLMLGVLFYHGLSLDPHVLPSVLVGKPAPEIFAASLFDPKRNLSLSQLKGHVILVHVWATWCISCQMEHPQLLTLARAYPQVVWVGLDYKDEAHDAQTWLNQHSNPYTWVGDDPQGKTAINWGVYGTPETFVIDKTGVIRDKIIGPLTIEKWQQRVLPWL